MALIFLDGMDHYAVGDTTLKYNVNAWSSMQTGLLGTGQCGRINNSNSGPTKTFGTTYTTFIMGFRYRCAGPVGTSALIVIVDGSNNKIASLCTTNTGALTWNQGWIGTQVGASGAGIIVGTAINYIEFKVTLATGATGSIEVKLNGADVINLTNVATSVTATAMTSFFFSNGNSGGGAGNGVADFDDFYLFDTTGAQNNTFAGDSKVVTAWPNGAGRVTQWTANGAASDYLCVNQTTPDADTTYVSSATVGQEDCYTLSSFGTLTSVKCVQINTDVRKDDAQTRTIAQGVGNGTTENFDAGTSVGSSYVYIVRPLDTNPLTSAAWATADLSTLQAAIKVIA